MQYISKTLLSCVLALSMIACVPTSRCILSQNDARIANRLPEQMARSSVRIDTFYLQITKTSLKIGEGHGSGVIFKVEAGRAWALTNKHVVSGNLSRGIMAFESSAKILTDARPVKVERVGAEIDVAVISFPIPRDVHEEDLLPVKFARRDVRVGDTVFWMGHPGGVWNHLRRGMVSGKCWINTPCKGVIPEGESGWTLDTPPYPGASGSQVINKRGQLVGIISQGILFQMGREEFVPGAGIIIGTPVLKEFMKDLLP